MTARGRRAPLLLTGLCLVPSAASGASADGVGGQVVSVIRVTSDGVQKQGAVLSADGSAVAWVVEEDRSAPAVVVAPADGSAPPRVLLRDNRETSGLFGVRGPHFEDSSYYRVRLAFWHLALSMDGSRLGFMVTEYTSTGNHHGFAVVDTRTGAIQVISLAAPPGMGPLTRHGHGLRPYGEGNWSMSADGSTLLWLAQGRAESGAGDAIIAQDIATGKARLVAGFCPLTGESDPPGSYYGPWASPTGTRVAFTAESGTVYVADFGPAGWAPRPVATLSTGLRPRLTAGGDYVCAQEKVPSTTVFRPVAGGSPVEVTHGGGFLLPFFDGRPGLVAVPFSPSGAGVIRVARPDGGKTVLKPGEHGLPAGWMFGVMASSNYHRWALGSADGLHVLLPMVSGDRRQSDLWALKMAGARPVSTAPIA